MADPEFERPRDAKSTADRRRAGQATEPPTIEALCRSYRRRLHGILALALLVGFIAVQIVIASCYDAWVPVGEVTTTTAAILASVVGATALVFFGLAWRALRAAAVEHAVRDNVELQYDRSPDEWDVYFARELIGDRAGEARCIVVERLELEIATRDRALALKRGPFPLALGTLALAVITLVVCGFWRGRPLIVAERYLRGLVVSDVRRSLSVRDWSPLATWIEREALRDFEVSFDRDLEGVAIAVATSDRGQRRVELERVARGQYRANLPIVVDVGSVAVHIEAEDRTTPPVTYHVIPRQPVAIHRIRRHRSQGDDDDLDFRHDELALREGTLLSIEYSVRDAPLAVFGLDAGSGYGELHSSAVVFDRRDLRRDASARYYSADVVVAGDLELSAFWQVSGRAAERSVPLRIRALPLAPPVVKLSMPEDGERLADDRLRLGVEIDSEQPIETAFLQVTDGIDSPSRWLDFPLARIDVAGAEGGGRWAAFGEVPLSALFSERPRAVTLRVGAVSGGVIPREAESRIACVIVPGAPDASADSLSKRDGDPASGRVKNGTKDDRTPDRGAADARSAVTQVTPSATPAGRPSGPQSGTEPAGRKTGSPSQRDGGLAQAGGRRPPREGAPSDGTGGSPSEPSGGT